MHQQPIDAAIGIAGIGQPECRCGARLTVRHHDRSEWLECPRVLDKRRYRSSPLMPLLSELLHVRRRLVQVPDKAPSVA